MADNILKFLLQNWDKILTFPTTILLAMIGWNKTKNYERSKTRKALPGYSHTVYFSKVLFYFIFFLCISSTPITALFFNCNSRTLLAIITGIFIMILVILIIFLLFKSTKVFLLFLKSSTKYFCIFISSIVFQVLYIIFFSINFFLAIAFLIFSLLLALFFMIPFSKELNLLTNKKEHSTHYYHTLLLRLKNIIISRKRWSLITTLTFTVLNWSLTILYFTYFDKILINDLIILIILFSFLTTLSIYISAIINTPKEIVTLKLIIKLIPLYEEVLKTQNEYTYFKKPIIELPSELEIMIRYKLLESYESIKTIRKLDPDHKITLKFSKYTLNTFRKAKNPTNTNSNNVITKWKRSLRDFFYINDVNRKKKNVLIKIQRKGSPKRRALTIKYKNRQFKKKLD